MDLNFLVFTENSLAALAEWINLVNLAVDQLINRSTVDRECLPVTRQLTQL